MHKQRLWIASAVVAGLAAIYAIAWGISEQRHADALVAFDAAIEKARAALEPDADTPAPFARDVVSVGTAWDLMAPFGEALIQDDAWNEFSEDIGSARGWTDESLAHAREWLDTRATTTLASARQVANRRIAIDPSDDPGASTLQPRQFVEAGRLVLLAAIVAMDEGDADEALADWFRALEIADAAGSANAGIWQIVRASLWRNALDLLPALIPMLSEEQREILHERLATAQDRNSLTAGLVHDLANVSTHAEDARRKHVVLRPWINENTTLTLRSMLPVLETVKDIATDPTASPGQVSLVPPPPARVPLLYRTGEDMRDSLYQSSHMLLQRQAAHDAALRLAQIGLVLWEQRDETGELPETLIEIAPSLSGPAVLDPFTGKPFVYRRFGNSFVLYSTGPNGIDDRLAVGRTEDDIVWGGN